MVEQSPTSERSPRSTPASRVTWNERLGRPECPYLIRWAIDLGRFGSIRLHHWKSSDDKRALHDHPSDFITLVLKGSYVDVSVERSHMKPGRWAYRKAEHRHYVDVRPEGCWTLLYFFPKRRNWGFWVPRKKDGKLKFKKSNKYFLEHGHHPCELR